MIYQDIENWLDITLYPSASQNHLLRDVYRRLGTQREVCLANEMPCPLTASGMDIQARNGKNRKIGNDGKEWILVCFERRSEVDKSFC